MKKIATITFHWAKNYGAVLQAYALQKYLEKAGYETEIINYLPARTMVLNFIAAAKKGDKAFFRKIGQFKEFRKTELKISKKRYFNNKALLRCKDKYSAIITGSDQVWNMSFTKKAEGKPTLSYFLNFAGDNTKKISYATSFGASKLDQQMIDLISPELEKFSAISVRENSGADIIADMGFKCQTVVDPTLLLEAQDYLSLLEEKNVPCEDEVFTYIIHSNQKAAEQTGRYVTAKLAGESAKFEPSKNCDVYEWLSGIKNAKYVVTNSFHGTVFSLIFRKPFVCVAIPGSGMNDRLVTLLDSVGLSKRFTEGFNEAEINELLDKNIDWDLVDTKLKELKEASKSFLTEALNN